MANYQPIVLGGVLAKSTPARVRGRIVTYQRVENPQFHSGFALALSWFLRVIFSGAAIRVAIYGGLLALAYYLIVDIRFPALTDWLFGVIAFGILGLFQAVLMFFMAGPFGPLPLIVIIFFVWFGGMRSSGGGDVISSVFMLMIMTPVRITFFIVRTIARTLLRTAPRLVRHLEVRVAQPLQRAIQHPHRDVTHELVVEYGAAGGLAVLTSLSPAAREDDRLGRPVNWAVADLGDPMLSRQNYISARIAGIMVGAPVAVKDHVVLYGMLRPNGVMEVRTGQNLTTNGVIEARPNPRF